MIRRTLSTQQVLGFTFYSKTHEWIRLVEDGSTTTTTSTKKVFILGVSDYAQQQMDAVVFVEFPEVGGQFKSGESLGVIESAKAANDYHIPIDGTILEVNVDSLTNSPELVNEDAEGSGWIVKFESCSSPTTHELEALLMDANAYREYVKEMS